MEGEVHGPRLISLRRALNIILGKETQNLIL
jgi:hypothetical protein